MSKLNKRQKLFINAYTSPESDTRGNATKSAVKAGYRQDNAQSTGCRLLKKDKITQGIARIEQTARDNAQVSREDMMLIAWRNYNMSTKSTTKLKWFQEYKELSGYAKPENQVNIGIKNEISPLDKAVQEIYAERK